MPVVVVRLRGLIRFRVIGHGVTKEGEVQGAPLAGCPFVVAGFDGGAAIKGCRSDGGDIGPDDDGGEGGAVLYGPCGDGGYGVRQS